MKQLKTKSSMRAEEARWKQTK